MLPTDWGQGWPHVWLGTTTENQEEANRRIPQLVAIPAVRFLSVEPIVEPVDVARWLVSPSDDSRAPISWIIVGGESGAWCDATFNPWIGCLRVSSACDRCYAAALSWRYGWRDSSGRDQWNVTADRKRTSSAYWRGPLRWNERAQAAGRAPGSSKRDRETDPRTEHWKQTK